MKRSSEIQCGMRIAKRGIALRDAARSAFLVPHSSPRTGFTLVELLVVIGILAILVSLTVGIWSQVSEHAWKSETRKRQAIIIDAVEAFYSTTRNYPLGPNPDADPIGGDPLRFAHASSALLKQQLDAVPASRQKLAAYPAEGVGSLPSSPSDRLFDFDAQGFITVETTSGSVAKINNTRDHVLLDALKEPMSYEAKGGRGGGPVIISGGGDKEIGDTKDNKVGLMSDNIRSDIN